MLLTNKLQLQTGKNTINLAEDLNIPKPYHLNTMRGRYYNGRSEEHPLKNFTADFFRFIVIFISSVRQRLFLRRRFLPLLRRRFVRHRHRFDFNRYIGNFAGEF